MANGVNQKRLEAKSADYEAMATYQDTVADVLKGQEAIRLAAERYLAKYPDETADEYSFRLKYTRFTNVWRDICEGLAAKPFEREIQFADDKNVDKRFIDFSDDVDGSGRNMTIFAMDYFFYGIAYSLDYLFVDYPTVPLKMDDAGRPIPRSVADEMSEGIRPYWSRVLCRNVYEVRTKVVKGRELITYFRMFEPASGDTPKRIREMTMTDPGKLAGFVIWEWNETANDYEQHSVGTFSIGYIPIVPFMTGRRVGRSFVSYPPLKDAVELQLTLYTSESNLELTKVYTAYPMLVGLGVAPEYDGEGDSRKPRKLIRGPGITLYAPMTKAGSSTDWKYIEPSAQSLSFLKTDIDGIKQDLRELGKQPLTVSSGNLTTITTAVAAGKAKSAVKAWVAGLTDALTMAYWYTSLWMGLGDDGPSVVVYDEFDEFLEPGQDVDALLRMNSSGKLSDDTLWEEMGRRKVLSVDFDPVEEKTRLLAQVPNVETTARPDNNPPQ